MGWRKYTFFVQLKSSTDELFVTFQLIGFDLEGLCFNKTENVCLLTLN